jgi:hypothetical protein
MSKHTIKFGENDGVWANKKGQLHRTDGPAIINKDGSRHWYVNNHKVTTWKELQEEAGLSDEEVLMVALTWGYM